MSPSTFLWVGLNVNASEWSDYETVITIAWLFFTISANTVHIVGCRCAQITGQNVLQVCRSPGHRRAANAPFKKIVSFFFVESQITTRQLAMLPQYLLDEFLDIPQCTWYVTVIRRQQSTPESWIIRLRSLDEIQHSSTHINGTAWGSLLRRFFRLVRRFKLGVIEITETMILRAMNCNLELCQQRRLFTSKNRNGIAPD